MEVYARTQMTQAVSVMMDSLELIAPTSLALTIPASLITWDTDKFANSATTAEHVMDTRDSATVSFPRRESPVVNTIA